MLFHGLFRTRKDVLMLRKSTMLRELLYAPEITVVMGAYDGLTARIAELSGFQALWAGGLSISAAHAVPDSGILTMTDFLRQAAYMNLATSLPVLADCDTGFGDVNNVINLVRHYESSGIAGVCIEDKAMPKRNSFSLATQHLAPVKEFCGKIDAAKSVQRDPDFVVVARVEALIVGAGMDEALSRASAYVEAGADAILIHSRSPGPGEVTEFARCWSGAAPLIVVPTTFPEVSAEELQGLGFSMCIYANQLLRAMVRTTIEACQVIRAEGTRSLEPFLLPVSDLFDLQDNGYFHKSARPKKHFDFATATPSANRNGREAILTMPAQDLGLSCAPEGS